jgi:Tol biopolymer transport system component
MTLVKRTRQHDVYVAAPGPDGRLVDARRLTLNDSNDVPTAWTPDSTAVYFSSDRNGNFDIFRQSLDGRILETIVEGPEDELGPTAVSPDGRWLYYVVQPKGWHLTWLRPVEVMRIPASGGAPEKFGGEAGIKQVSCARSPSTTCVLIERASNQHEVAVYVVDPSNGKGRVITTIPVSGASSFYPAAISPDGTRVAVLMAREEKIHIVSLSGESPHDVRVTSRPLDMEAISWAADGAGVYVSSTSYTGVPSGTDLLHVDVNGRVSVVWHGSPPEPTVGIASPDGRHIAITYTSAVSNVWLLKF